jgi:hypothetical protein
MLYQVSNIWECGFIEEYVAYSSSSFSLSTHNIKSSIVQVFKYRIESSTPVALVYSNNKKYILPNWIPCHPKTELSDIIWIKKSPKNQQEINTWKFKSSSGDGEYVTKKNGFKYTCNCPGIWRSKDRECKHIKEVKGYENK